MPSATAISVTDVDREQLRRALSGFNVCSVTPVRPTEVFEGKHFRGEIFGGQMIHLFPRTSDAQEWMGQVVSGLAEKAEMSWEWLAEVDAWCLGAKKPFTSETALALLDAADILADEIS